jgi:hypothetical protein
MIWLLFEYDANFEIIKFNPLLKWTAGSRRLFRKIMYHKMHYTKKVCKHWLCALYRKPSQQMKTSEPDDGGGNQS